MIGDAIVNHSNRLGAEYLFKRLGCEFGTPQRAGSKASKNPAGNRTGISLVEQTMRVKQDRYAKSGNHRQYPGPVDVDEVSGVLFQGPVQNPRTPHHVNAK